MLLNCLCVGIGGAIGSVRRYLLGLLPVRPAGGFPLITLGINVLGAFCIGLLMALAGRHTGWDPRLLLLLKVGVCGGFTTFSTLCSESCGFSRMGGPVWPRCMWCSAFCWAVRRSSGRTGAGQVAAARFRQAPHCTPACAL